MQMVYKILVSISLITCVGCGVKGKPQAPLNPSPIGRGEPIFEDSSKDNQKKTIPSLETKSGD